MLYKRNKHDRTEVPGLGRINRIEHNDARDYAMNEIHEGTEIGTEIEDEQGRYCQRALLQKFAVQKEDENAVKSSDEEYGSMNGQRPVARPTQNVASNELDREVIVNGSAVKYGLTQVK